MSPQSRLVAGILLILLLSDRDASPELTEPRETSSDPDKLLSWVSVLWLLNATTGAAVAIRENLPGELIGGVFIGRDASADFCKGPGTALSPGLAHIAAQVALAILSTRGGRAGMAGAAGLIVVGAGATAGALGEKITYAVLSPKTFDPAKAAIVSAGVALSSLMTILGARRLLALGGRR
jgi:hypothetical protein